MKKIKQLLRIFHIHFILARNGLDKALVTHRLFTPFRFLVYFNPWNWYRREPLARGVALRKTLEELGPVFVKFGQALSTRPDILPPDIALELCKLQDKVPPFNSKIALSIVESSFNQSAFEVFAEFDPTPMASASMAQIHAATLKTGEEVVVKILRPNMKKIIEQDLNILYTLANIVERYWSVGKRLRPREIVKEFEYSLFNELNLQREAANAGQLKRNFQQSPLLYVPEIYWDYVRENILVMERIHGIPVTDVDTMKRYGINIKKLAERGIIIFFTQVFRDCFFHADMHPGNIFVSFLNPEEPQYICVDFGIMGTLNDRDKRYLAENLLAFFNRDYRRVAQLHIESGWVDKYTREEELESAIRTVCEPVFQKPLKDISFAYLVLQLFQVARKFNMEVQPQLILLQKTLLAIEGLGRQLYPELDLWMTAKPFLAKWVREQIGPKAFFKHVRENIPFIVEQLPYMPRLLNEVLLLHKAQVSKNLDKFDYSSPTIHPHDSWYKGLSFGVFSATIIISGIYYLNILPPNMLAMIALGAALCSGAITFGYRKRMKVYN